MKVLSFFLLAGVFQSVLSKPMKEDLGNFPSLLLRVKQNRIHPPRELHEECNNCQPKPLDDDLDVRKLTKLLGGRLDHTVVSLTRPEDPPPTDERISLSHASKAKRRALRELIRNGTHNMADFSGTLSREMERFMMGWLLQRENCPVVYSWRDMGPHFWPRFVKRATCKSKQCSIDPSTQCEPSNSRYFNILRWHCMDDKAIQLLPLWGRHRAVRRSGHWCSWLRFYHPITTECSCACSAKVVRRL
ncbi:noggin [Nematostella vectensis]|uniref:noggin n=1 Tax=Nematostella vectensis TaxID=45351 RepID=UPI00138FAAB7|nr:noggin [Nematostella vectensis]